jgi:predicted metal-dependent phosphoesterase TrpH
MPVSYIPSTPNMDKSGKRPEDDSGVIMFDMHVHSMYSNDSITDTQTIIHSWEKTGILPLVCDHDSITGSEKVYSTIRKMNPNIPEILAEEILTAEGEIIGAFLNEEIAPGLSADETLDIIEDQGAISIVPHPFCTYRKTTIDNDTLDRIAGRVDVIEGYNARTPDPGENLNGRAFAGRTGKPLSVGSDAHTPGELAINYIRITEFSTPGELIRNLPAGEVNFSPAPHEVHEFTIMFKKLRREGDLNNFQGNIEALLSAAGIVIP